jgi:hypothetical protein
MIENAWTIEPSRLRNENTILRQSNEKLVKGLLLEKRKAEDVRRGLEAMVKMIEIGRVNHA